MEPTVSIVSQDDLLERLSSEERDEIRRIALRTRPLLRLGDSEAGALVVNGHRLSTFWVRSDCGVGDYRCRIAASGASLTVLRVASAKPSHDRRTRA